MGPLCGFSIVAHHMRAHPIRQDKTRQDPRSVVRLYNNTYLITNISVLQMHCPQSHLEQPNAPMQILHLNQIQSIHSFDCHCDFLAADEYRIITD